MAQISILICLGGSRGGHGDESGRSTQRYVAHGAAPGDATPVAPQTRTRRPHDVANIVPAQNTLDDVITTSMFADIFFDVNFYKIKF